MFQILFLFLCLILFCSRARVAGERTEEGSRRLEEHPRSLQPLPHRQHPDPRKDQEPQQHHQRSRYTRTGGVFVEEHQKVSALLGGVPP